jgi:cellobiose dehydrogenase (acceptor)
MQGTITSYGYADYQCPSCFTLNVYGTSGLQSRGRVDLDANWVPTPSSDTLYQSNSTDADDIASFIQSILQVLGRTNITSLNIPQNATQSQIRDYITTSSPYAHSFTNHWGGSTKLSESCDSGVVTPNAKVCGMENLYIVDGGIIPTLFTVNPQYGIMVAGEHASTSILADRGDCCGCLGHTSAVCPVADSTAATTSGTSGTAGTSTPSVSSAALAAQLRRSSLLLAFCILGLSFALSFLQ